MASFNTTLNPLESLECIIAFDSQDYGSNTKLIWIYGIVFGWDDECFKQFKKEEKLNDTQIKRLKLLHENFKELKMFIEDYFPADKGGQE